MNLTVVFNYLVSTLRESNSFREVKVLDTGALMVSQTPYGFEENIAIYLLAGELSLEFIKTAVNANTRSDIHTLFILSHDLLPEDGSYVTPDESLRLLLDLFMGKVYAYDVQREGVKIFPVYIDSKVTYGQPVDILNLGCDYVELRSSKYIRGVRKIADFSERNSYRPTGEHRTHDPLQPFYDLLGVAITATEDEVKKAYRKKARQHHPDTDPSPDATEKMQAINDAYDRILKRFSVIS
jgi:hypothetical protein